MNKRDFLKGCILFFPAGGFAALAGGARASTEGGEEAPKDAPATVAPEAPEGNRYDATEHLWGMGIEVEKCIGCNRCVVACKTENDVPPEPFYFRTWVERYVIKWDGEVQVEDISLGEHQRREMPADIHEVVRTFFVPKLCNHCENPPCVQVCPVGATFSTRDGAVIVDKERCIGCRYCIQACPYGARFLNPRTHTADKCTFCYHRITRGLLPACVEVCPTQARIFGDLKSKANRLVRLFRTEKIHVLKPDLNTKPKVYYAKLDGEVR